jgi:hypothetical protein
LPSEFSSAHAELLQLLSEMFSRVNRTDCHDGLLLMVIDNLHV